MTHQPPVPKEATSPYPLHPAPIPEEVKVRAAAAAEAEKRDDEAPSRPSQSTVFGIGAAVALGAAAALGGLLYARRSPASPQKPKRKAAAKQARGTGKKARSKSRATRH